MLYTMKSGNLVFVITALEYVIQHKIAQMKIQIKKKKRNIGLVLILSEYYM